MCGRFTLRSSGKVVAEAFDLPEVPELQPRFNIAPTQPVAAVRQRPDFAERELTFLRWGLIPAWADDPSIGDRMANTRSETTIFHEDTYRTKLSANSSRSSSPERRNCKKFRFFRLQVCKMLKKIKWSCIVLFV